MAAVRYDVIGAEGDWRVSRDRETPSEMSYATKEAAFEAAAGAAMLSLREGFDVTLTVRGREPGESALGNELPAAARQ